MSAQTVAVEAPARRLARLVIQADALLASFSVMADSGRIVRSTGIPPGTVVVGLCVDRRFNQIEIIVENPAFDPVHEGWPIPELNVAFSTERA